MKLLYATLILLFFMASSYAQSNAITERRTAEFISYFNANKMDSLYALLADDLKAKAPASTLEPAIQQLKGLHGKLTSHKYAGKGQGVNVYMAMFEKQDLVLQINFDAGNRIIGFYAMPNRNRTEGPGAITVKTKTAVIKGTLSVPLVKDPMPVVLLIAGSGPTDRDGNSQLLSGKSNYLSQISDSLNLRNIAVLRYDKRGVGQSTTSKAINEVTLDDMVEDATEIVRMLKSDKRFSRVIIAGHSEGALIGMLASIQEKPAATISISGASSPVGDLLKKQLKESISSAEYEKASLVIDSIKTGNFPKRVSYDGYYAMFNPTVQPFLHSWMKYKPKEIISKLTMPVLILQGSHDIQVGDDNARALKKANASAQLRIIPGMSHILKVAPIDMQQNMATYSDPKIPLHPQLIPEIMEFIKNIK